jgi:TolB-like protein/class 3 adenylate cyclase/Flp pilus assembly protein TadD
LAAILAADVVGYSRLVEQDEAGTLAALKKLRAEVIDPLLAKHKGRIVKLMGDGAIVEFRSVVDAVVCAVALQKQCAAAQVDVSSDRRIVFRIGVNLGDVVVEGDDLLGDGVNVAARLEQLCDPGGVLLSGTAYDQLQGKLHLPLDFAGEQQVKNIARPVRAYRVRLDGSGLPWRLRLRQHRRGMPRAATVVVAVALLAAGWWWLRPVVEPLSAKASIAVLPFDNIGADAQTGRLADGITEDTITDLSRFREIEVIARNSVEVYKDKAADVRQIGRDLNVRYVLEGSIQQAGDNVRVTAQLIEAASGTHVWSDQWDRPAADIFAVQTELAEHLAAKLAGQTGIVLTADREAARRKRPHDLTAYDLYLLGGAAILRETPEGTNEAIALLKRSLEIDPNFARAWTRLTMAYEQQLEAWSGESADLRKLTLETAKRAVDLDSQDAEAHAMLASQLGFNGDFVRSEVELERALELNPNSAEILLSYAGWAGTFGKPEYAVELAERAVRLNPNPPLWVNGILRMVYYEVGRYNDAWRWHERRPPGRNDRWDYLMSGMLLAELGRTTEAQAAVTEDLAKFPDTSIEGWLGTPNWNEVQRKQYGASMRKAGFPVCATPNELKTNPNLIRLPECVKAQASH